MNFIREISQELQFEQELRKKCSAGLKGIEKINLSCYTKEGKKYYRIFEKGKYIHLKKSDKQMVLTQKKRYLYEQMIHILDHNISLLDKLLKNFQEYDPFIISRSFKPAFQDIPASLMEELGFKNPTTPSPSSKKNHSEGLLHTTRSGLMVRSRIEAIIADIYYSKSIPFEYEKLLILPDGTSIYPDFTVYHQKKGYVIYHEHIGMLSDPDYLKSFLWKLEKYVRFGYYPFEKVIFTFDNVNGSINASEIAEIIDLYCR